MSCACSELPIWVHGTKDHKTRAAEMGGGGGGGSRDRTNNDNSEGGHQLAEAPGLLRLPRAAKSMNWGSHSYSSNKHEQGEITMAAQEGSPAGSALSCQSGTWTTDNITRAKGAGRGGQQQLLGGGLKLAGFEHLCLP